MRTAYRIWKEIFPQIAHTTLLQHSTIILAYAYIKYQMESQKLHEQSLTG